MISDRNEVSQHEEVRLWMTDVTQLQGWIKGSEVSVTTSSLPHRQLRNIKWGELVLPYGSLPHRQLRNRCQTAGA